MTPFDPVDIKNFDALLFDLDGTLVDSMPSHNKAWQTVFADLGHSITEEELYSLAGTPNLQTAEIFIDRFGLDIKATDVIEKKEGLFEKTLTRLQRINVVSNIAEAFYGSTPMGVVSGSSRERVIASLNATKLASLFNCIVSCDDTERAKPFPDPFLKAASLLQVNAERCLVFEDGAAGIEAATQAKMNIVYVKNPNLFWVKHPLS